MSDERTEVAPETKAALPREWLVRSARGSHVVRQPTAAEAIATYRGIFIVPADVEVSAEPYEAA
jgi:hypothetical protein